MLVLSAFNLKSLILTIERQHPSTIGSGAKTFKQKNAGTQFDPNISKMFVEMLSGDPNNIKD